MFTIRYEGRIFEIKPKVFELSLKAQDGEIMSRTADWLGVPPEKLNRYTVERLDGGRQIVVRRLT